MQPKTKLEKEVMNLSKTLKPLSPSIIEWATEKCFEHLAISTTASKWCTDCGHHWNDREQKGYCICPKCGKKLRIENGNNRSVEFKDYYFTVIQKMQNFQIINTFNINKFSKKNCKAVYNISNVIQIWINSKGKETIVAKNISMGYYNDFDLYSNLSIKKNPKYYNKVDYHLYGEIYPHKNIINELKKRGCTKLFNCNPATLFLKVLSNEHYYETLLKTKQYSLLEYFTKSYNGIEDDYKKAINICNRNKYIIKDASLWIDYVKLLQYFNKDIHNAKYLCADNIKESHDILLRRKQKKEEKERQKRILIEKIQKLKERKEDIHNFYENKMKFFGIKITTKDFNIVPLESITQFYLEGKNMKHCVFQCDYFKNDNSLILSARDKNGVRIETIELSLSNFEIIQSRAICNGTSKYHNQIERTIKKNIAIFKQRLIA